MQLAPVLLDYGTYTNDITYALLLYTLVMSLLPTLCIIVRCDLFTRTCLITPYDMKDENERALHTEIVSICILLMFFIANSSYKVTCSELKTVKSHANAVVLLLTVSRPKAQVSPSRGKRTSDATNIAL